MRQGYRPSSTSRLPALLRLHSHGTIMRSSNRMVVMSPSSVLEQRRWYAYAIKDRPAPAAMRRDKPKPQPNATTKQSGRERDGGLAGLTQLEASPAVPAGRVAHLLDHAQSNSYSLHLVRRVLNLIKKVEGNHRNEYGLLISALAKARDITEKERMGSAQILYDRMQQLQSDGNAKLFDVAILSTLIKIFAVGGDWSRCEALMQHMRDENIRPTVVTYTNLLKYCERVESWHKAAEVLERMKVEAPGLKPDVVFYTSLINVCCTRNDLQQALRVLGDMKTDGVKPNIFTYTSLINICEREKNLRKALDLLEEMKGENIQPNVYIFTSLINVCEKKKDLVTAMRLFEEMTRLYKIQPNTFTFNSLLNVCVEKRDLDKAMGVLAMMRQYYIVPNTSTFNSLASLCAKTGNVAKGIELLGTMKTSGVPADNLTFTLLIAACRVRDAEDFNPPAPTATEESEATPAEEAAAPAEVTQVSPPLEQALSLLNRMKPEFNVAPDNITLVTLVSVCLRSRRLSYAMRAYSQAKAEMAQNRALQLDKENYYELINLCAKKGQWRRGLDIMKDMENAGLMPSVRIYNSFLRNFDPILNREDAEEVVRLMRSKNVEDDDTTKVLLKRLGLQPRHVHRIVHRGSSAGEAGGGSRAGTRSKTTGGNKREESKPRTGKKKEDARGTFAANSKKPRRRPAS